MRLVHVTAAALIVALAACTDQPVPGATDSVAAGGDVTPDPSNDDSSAAAGATPPASAPAAGAPSDSAALIGREWALQALDDAVIAVPSGGQSPTLRVDAADGRLAAVGNAGCNRFRGPVTLDGTTVRLGPLMSTRMACPALDLERRYMAALDTARGFRVTANALELLSGERVVARFSSP